MPTRAKSRNDTKKEAAEEQCFKLALDAARRRGGGTYKIMSYLNGQNIDTRAKKDRPDLIRLCTNAKHEEVIVGIEHFCVNQMVKRVGDRYKSVGKELRGHIDATYKKATRSWKLPEKFQMTFAINCLKKACCWLNRRTPHNIGAFWRHFAFLLKSTFAKRVSIEPTFRNLLAKRKYS